MINNQSSRYISRQLNNSFLVAYLFILAPIMAYFAGIRFFGVGTDYDNYILMFTTNSYKTEPFFTWLSQINQLFFPNDVIVIFTICAYLGLLIKSVFFIKYSKHSLLCIIIYTITLYFLHEYIQIRAAIGLGFCYLSTEDILKKKKYSFFLKICIALMFHKSAILFLFVYFFVYIFKELRSVVILCWISFLFAIFLSTILHKVSLGYIVSQKFPSITWLIIKGGSLSIYNPFSVFNITYFIIMLVNTLYYLFLRDKADISDFDYLICKISFLAPICFYLLLNLGFFVWTFRISEMFLFYFIPVLVNLFYKIKCKIFVFPCFLLVIMNLLRVLYHGVGL